MVSTKYIPTDGVTKRFVSEFTIKSEQHVRVYLSDTDPNVTIPPAEDVVSLGKWALVNNYIEFYETPAANKWVTLEVATEVEELGHLAVGAASEEAEYYAGQAEYYSNLAEYYAGLAGPIDWNDVTNKPAIGDMFKVNYDSNNDGKVNAADVADSVEWVNVQNKPAGSVGNIMSPLLDAPLVNSLDMRVGAGSITLSRASTATYIDRYGVLQYAAINEPRFEKDGLLIEGSSTNRLVNSNDFTWWAKEYVGDGTIPVVTPNYADSPDGTQNATRLQCSITDDTDPNNMSQINSGAFVGFTNPSKRTISVWIKSNTPNEQKVYIRDHIGIDERIVVTVTAEWKRYSLERSEIPSDTGRILIGTRGDYGTDTDVDVLIAFAQYEELPFASSYIPTVDNSVTRGIDYCYVQMLNNDPYYLDDLTVSYSCKTNGVSQSYTHSLSSKSWFFSHNTNTGAELLYVYKNGRYTDTSSSTSPYGIRETLTMTYNGANIYLYKNGVVFRTTTANTAPPTSPQDDINIGSKINEHAWFGNIKDLKVYDKALTSDEVALLGGQ